MTLTIPLLCGSCLLWILFSPGRCFDPVLFTVDQQVSVVPRLVILTNTGQPANAAEACYTVDDVRYLSIPPVPSPACVSALKVSVGKPANDDQMAWPIAGPVEAQMMKFSPLWNRTIYGLPRFTVNRVIVVPDADNRVPIGLPSLEPSPARRHVINHTTQYLPALTVPDPGRTA